MDDFQPSWGNHWAPPLLFGRRPPQSNYPPDTVPDPDNGSRLETQYFKGGIPRLTPRKLTSSLQSLPPILYIKYRVSISSYSKAPRGLSVLSRVTCIFTGIKISPSLWSRQHPDHYTFRAGQNLPDKEFRYLRTVIVTAAVHWGFNSDLCLIDLRQSWAVLLTFQHWAGVTPYTSSYDLAESCVFGKQLPGPLYCGSIAWPPLIPKLRGHYAEFLNHSSLAHLRILSLPTCVGSRYRHLYN